MGDRGWRLTGRIIPGRWPHARLARQTRTRHGGAGIIGLLLVVVIIMIVLLTGPFSKDEVTKVTMAQTQTDRAAEAACAMNRDSLKATITQFSVTNPGAPPSLTIIRKTGQPIPTCPRGGEYVVGRDGTIYCTKHYPPPPDEMRRLGLTNQPERTPEPLPDIAPAEMAPTATPAPGVSPVRPPAATPPAH